MLWWWDLRDKNVNNTLIIQIYSQILANKIEFQYLKTNHQIQKTLDKDYFVHWTSFRKRLVLLNHDQKVFNIEEIQNLLELITESGAHN